MHAWILAAGAAIAGDVSQGANLLAQGGVGVAAPGDNAAITMNPGLLGLDQRYDFHGHFRLGPSAGMQWGLSALDARTSKVVSLGVSYSGDRFEPPLRISELPGWALPGEEIGNLKSFHDFGIGLGITAIESRLCLGFGGNIGMYRHDRQGNGVLWDLHTGIGLRVVDPLVVGFAVRDLVPGSGEDRPLQVLGGARVDAKRISFEADLGFVPEAPELESPLIVAGGLELPIAAARIRLGGRYDGPDDKPWASTGLGYETDGGSIEYGLAVPLVAGSKLAATVHQVSVRFGAQTEPEPF